MNQINWWMVTTLTLGAVIIGLFLVSWVAPCWTDWETSHSETYAGTPRTLSAYRGFFSPLMFLMPFAWLVIPIFGVVCMIRWLNGEPRWRYLRTEYEHAACSNCGRWRHADWRACPYCGHAPKSKEAHNV
jgi:hypothetical protein